MVGVVAGPQPDPVAGRHRAERARITTDTPLAMGIEENGVVEHLAAPTSAATAVRTIRPDPGDAATGHPQHAHRRRFWQPQNQSAAMVQPPTRGRWLEELPGANWADSARTRRCPRLGEWLPVKDDRDVNDRDVSDLTVDDDVALSAGSMRQRHGVRVVHQQCGSGSVVAEGGDQIRE